MLLVNRRFLCVNDDASSLKAPERKILVWLTECLGTALSRGFHPADCDVVREVVPWETRTDWVSLQIECEIWWDFGIAG